MAIYIYRTLAINEIAHRRIFVRSSKQLYIEILVVLFYGWMTTVLITTINEQADQAAKEGAAGGSHMKATQTPIPWQVAKNKIEVYTTDKWKQKWITAPHYKHTKLFYDSPNKNKSKYILKMGTHMLSTWVKSITGHNNFACLLYTSDAADE